MTDLHFGPMLERRGVAIGVSRALGEEKQLLKLEPGNWMTVDPIHCHQRFPHNTLISRLKVVEGDGFFTELECKFEPDKLTFFYDHSIDHLPGMLETCTMRQAALALAHLVYGIPMSYVALLDWMDIKLFNYGELNIPTFARFKLIGFKSTPNKFELVLDGLLIQQNYPVMNTKGKCVMISPDLSNQIRHRKRAVGLIADKFVSVNIAPGIAS